MKLYRGTQRTDPKGVRVQSWTPSLPVAVIYSAVPGNPFGSRPDAYFTETSTIHVATLPKKSKVLRLCGDGISCSFYEVLTQLNYPDGISNVEAKKILNYMHNRIMGKAAGGEFQYKFYDEEGEEEEDDGFSFSGTSISRFRDEMLIEEDGILYMYDINEMKRLVADTFIYADAPAFKTAARRLGFDVVRYADVFVGGVSAAETLLNCDDIQELAGISEDLDLEYEEVPIHETYRPLHEEAIVVEKSVPVEEMLDKVTCRTENPRKRVTSFQGVLGPGDRLSDVLGDEKVYVYRWVPDYANDEIRPGDYVLLDSESGRHYGGRHGKRLSARVPARLVEYRQGDEFVFRGEMPKRAHVSGQNTLVKRNSNVGSLKRALSR